LKVINMLAVVDGAKCTGCKTCERVCPVLAIKVVNKVAVVDEKDCRSCYACEQRCPEYAIAMVKRAHPFVVGADIDAVEYERVVHLCAKARFHPEQLVCYCSATRAEEVAAAILQGAHTPERVSLVTGVRTGCKVECIEPILRLLEAAGIRPVPPKGGWQWYGRTVTAWEIPEATKKKYASRGFYFDEDIALLDRVANAPLQGRRKS
jgi:NAD-dependent dihydropyrimidine dehydrogenase PreA subunit/bacterioferritin-associated ferredoxin